MIINAPKRIEKRFFGYLVVPSLEIPFDFRDQIDSSGLVTIVDEGYWGWQDQCFAVVEPSECFVATAEEKLRNGEIDTLEVWVRENNYNYLASFFLSSEGLHLRGYRRSEQWWRLEVASADPGPTALESCDRFLSDLLESLEPSKSTSGDDRPEERKQVCTNGNRNRRRSALRTLHSRFPTLQKFVPWRIKRVLTKYW